jgi:nucleoside recognition membrane protein YjiH
LVGTCVPIKLPSDVIAYSFGTLFCIFADLLPMLANPSEILHPITKAEVIEDAVFENLVRD